MQLFNVDHEQWEEVITGPGSPPADALAYAVEAAKWLTTERELDSMAHHERATLRYTNRGVEILRKGGYEG